MIALNSLNVDKGWKASGFNLISVDNNYYVLEDIYHDKGVVVAFICNHCPYVKEIVDQMVEEAEELRKIGVGFVAINSNDSNVYPEDSFENMQIFAAKHKFQFPYLWDKTQEVAKKYNAVCTPDFFGFNASFELQYRGRLNDAKNQSGAGIKRELFIAMSQIAEQGCFDGVQSHSIGCSIKWK